jgi:predicted heme/steroid binding protein
MNRIKKRTDRHLLLLAILLVTAVVVGACSGATATTGTTGTTGSAAEQTFTVEELAQYDGLEGRKAYIAVDGVVYDVTEIPQWKEGIHQGRFQAGKDYSQEIRTESPHGLSMLSRATKVGVLVD